MRRLMQFVSRRDGAVSIEWVMATAALMIGSIFMAYLLTGGVDTIREENNRDFNRVKIQDGAGGGGGSPGNEIEGLGNGG